MLKSELFGVSGFVNLRSATSCHFGAARRLRKTPTIGKLGAYSSRYVRQPCQHHRGQNCGHPVRTRFPHERAIPARIGRATSFRGNRAVTYNCSADKLSARILLARALDGRGPRLRPACARCGEVPVGAVVVCAGRIVGRGWNRNLTDNDPPRMRKSWRCARRDETSEITGSATANCLLQLSRAPCARELRCMLASAVWYMRRRSKRRVQSIRFWR